MLWLMVPAIVFVISLFATGWLYAHTHLTWRMAWIPIVGIGTVPLLFYGLTSSGPDPLAAASSAALAEVPLIAWPMGQSGLEGARVEPLRWSPVSRKTSQGSNTAAPVASLVQGLRARLEQNPNDAAGWALLAQSYAFLGEPDLSKHAMERAIALGTDEAVLRERVEQAAHSTAAADQRAGSLDK